MSTRRESFRWRMMLDMRPTNVWLELDESVDAVFDIRAHILRNELPSHTIQQLSFKKHGGRWWRDVISVCFPAFGVLERVALAVNQAKLSGLQFHSSSISDPTGKEYLIAGVTGRTPRLIWPDRNTFIDPVGESSREHPITVRLPVGSSLNSEDFSIQEETWIVLCTDKAHAILSSANVKGVVFDCVRIVAD